MTQYYTDARALGQIQPQRPSVFGGKNTAVHLGIYAKYSPPPFFIPENAPVVGPDRAADTEKINIVQGIRAERYALLSTARTLISAAGRTKGLEFGHNLHRTAKCKFIRHGGDYVCVHKDQAHNKAFFSNLVTCGSVWSCPVCAAKIQERRREEIAKSIDWAYQNDFQPVLVTLTFPHKSWQKLRALLDQQADALKRLRQGSPWQRFKDDVNFQGMIRSLELTHGANGWHPHTHELWFVKKDAEADYIKAEIIKRWAAACVKSGLLDDKNIEQMDAFFAHAVDVKGHCSASDYLAKQDDSRHWGADREMAKASSKAGKAKGKHAFGLLADAKTDRRSGRLYMVYIMAMRGKRQIYWSQGLKKTVGIGEVSDEQLAEEQREPADLLGHINDEDWSLIRSVGARAAVLDAAESGGWPAITVLIESLIETEIQRLQALLYPRAGVGLSNTLQAHQGPLTGLGGYA